MDENELTEDDMVPKGELSRIFPIFGHRFIMVDPNSDGKRPVLSMYGNDIIPWAPFLQWAFVRDHLKDMMGGELGDELPDLEEVQPLGWQC
jgi:hypothetical protein